MLVPIFAIASWASLTSLRAAFWIDPFRDVYEAFTLYSFFQILVSFLGGERSLIIMMHGRPPVSHLWPVNMLPGIQKVDISDPHTFLAVKRGILQYVWIKPLLALATIAMKATGTFKEGIIGWSSGYFWTSLIYNVSIFWSLYDLALFWVCMNQDLQPFRPMPKFLCIKGIIFASWWQGFFLSILVWLGAIPSVGGGYTADNLAAAIQDALICFEMPLFAISHWYAFSWKDYADPTVSEARMPMRFAFRDAFGPRDLIEDAKETWSGNKYEYRYFDAEDNVIAHEESTSRRARMREGMRYERGGRGKYWIPSSGAGGGEAKQPLLSKVMGEHAPSTMSPAFGGARDESQSRSSSHVKGYGTTTTDVEEMEKDPDEERLYAAARAMEFGDWNYPVINTHYASRQDAREANPPMMSGSTNRNILQPTAENRKRRQSRIKDIRENVVQHNKPGSSSHRGSSSSGSGDAPTTTLGKGKEKLQSLPVVGAMIDRITSTASSSDDDAAADQLVDLVVEDTEAGEIERVRARKEGGPGWNSVEQKHYVKTFPGEEDAEEVRHGFNPDRPEGKAVDDSHTLGEPRKGDEKVAISEVPGRDETGAEQPWEERRYGEFEDDERKAWGEGK